MAQNTERIEGNLLRETPYAKTLMAVSCVRERGNEDRLERLLVRRTGSEEIRFVWWRNGQMRAKPPDMPEDDLLELLEKGFRAGVFTRDFTVRLREMLDRILIEEETGT